MATPNYDRIPQAMKDCPHWVLWKIEQIDGRPTKVPYQTNGRKASSTNPKTWSDFEKVKKAYEMHIGEGIGFVFTRDTFSGIDLDHCRDKSGEIDFWAEDYLSKFNSYTEISPSGEGAHIIVKGDIPEGCTGGKKNLVDPEGTPILECMYQPKAAIEIYSEGRFFTMTGNRLDGHPETVEERKDVLRTVYQELFGKKKPKTTTISTLRPYDLSDKALILKATLAKNGNKFKQLWDGSTLGYGSQSEADQALMNKLAFWTGKDPARMERLFSESALGKRNKWTDRPDYRERTIQTAIADTVDIYEPPNAELDIDDLCHSEVMNEGKPNEYIKHTFSPDKAADAITKKFHIVTTEDNAIWVYEDGIYSTNDWQHVSDLVKIVAGDKFPTKMKKELEFDVASKTRGKAANFDKNPYLLCCKNVTVDLRTREVLRHSPEHLLTDQIDVTYDPTAKCPKFIQFLEDVAPNPTDRLMLIDWYAVHAIREMFPYILFLNGLGRNGKGVYERVLKRFFGENTFSGMPLEELSTKYNRFAGADLAGKRGQIVAEAGESHAKGKRTIPTAFLKNATGDGVIDSDQKNKGRIKFKPFYKSTIDSNDMPRIEDSSKGWIERFCKADMPFSYVDDPKNSMERKKDPRLFDKLTTPEELSGILNLILSRTPDIIKTGAITKRSGSEMFAEYQKQSNSVTTFLENFCAYKPEILRSEDVALEVVYEAYQNWCDLTVSDKVSDQRFGSTVKNLCNGIKSERIRCTCGGRIRIYHGFTFDAKAYQSQVSQSVPTLSQQNKEQSQVSQDIGQNTWEYIKEKFGETPPLNPSENEKPPHFSPPGTDIDSQNTAGTDNGHLGTDLIPPGTDIDSTAERKKERSQDVDLGEPKIGPHPRRDEPTRAILTRVRFKTAYETDINGQMKQFPEGDEAEVSRERAEAWVKRGIVELVA